MKTKIYEYLKIVNRNEIDCFDSTSFNGMAGSLGIEKLDLNNELNSLYDTCALDLSYKVIESRIGPKVIFCKYIPINVSDLNYFLNEIRAYGDSENVRNHLKFVHNQFYSCSLEQVSEIMSLYFHINEKINNLKSPKVKDIHVSYQFLNDCDFPTELVPVILEHGYCKKTKEGFIWKVYNPNPTAKEEPVVKEESYSSIDIGNIKTLAESILSEIGIKTEPAFDKDSLLTNLDDLFNEFESMEDWEKIKNSQMIINTWKEIRNEFFDRS